MSAWKPRYCQHSPCGKPIKRNGGSKDARKYCTKKCYFDAVRAGTQQFKGRVHDVWAALVDWAYTWDAERPKPRLSRDRKPRHACQHCGKECNVSGTRFCSLSCTKAWRGDRLCKCGAVVPNSSAFSRPACEACKRDLRRQKKRMYGCYRRRCRTYGGHFNPNVKPRGVFVRDGWRCHICGKKTSKFFRLSDPRSATVDHHPIPLSKGGDHDWHNVRCACFACNTLKGARWDGQMRLQLL